MVGTSSVSINYFLHRLVCANGMMAPAGKSINRVFHSGNRGSFKQPGDQHSLKALYRFYAPMSLGGKMYRVKLTVRGFIDPNRGLGRYDLEAVEIEKGVDPELS